MTSLSLPRFLATVSSSLFGPDNFVTDKYQYEVGHAKPSMNITGVCQGRRVREGFLREVNSRRKQ